MDCWLACWSSWLKALDVDEAGQPGHVYAVGVVPHSWPCRLSVNPLLDQPSFEPSWANTCMMWFLVCSWLHSLSFDAARGYFYKFAAWLGPWPAGLDLWLEELDPTELNLDTWDLTLDLLDSTSDPSSWPMTSETWPVCLDLWRAISRDLIRASCHLDPWDLTVYILRGHFRTVHGNMLARFEVRIFNHIGASSI